MLPRQRPEGLTGIVLAGGHSLRLGQDKALLEFQGEPLVRRVVRRLAPLCQEVLVVVANHRTELPLEGEPKVQVVVDLRRERGALGGVYTGLKLAASPLVVAVACDMPFLDTGLLRHLVELAPGYDAVVPRHSGGLEPLHSVYAKSCLKPMKELLTRGPARVDALYPLVRVRSVGEEELAQFPGYELSFFNINTLEDLERALALDRRGVDARTLEGRPVP